jgi:hypothetical protein
MVFDLLRLTETGNDRHKNGNAWGKLYTIVGHFSV